MFLSVSGEHANRRHEISQTQKGQFRIRVSHRLTERQRADPRSVRRSAFLQGPATLVVWSVQPFSYLGIHQRGVQWVGVVLYDKQPIMLCKPLHPVSTAPPFDES